MPGGPPGLRADVSGAGMYRYMATAAVFKCMEAMGDKGQFDTAVEFLITVASPHLWDPEIEGEWKALQDRVLVDAQGKPLKVGDSIPKMARHEMARFIIRIWHARGVYGPKKQPTEDTEFLQDALAKRNAQLAEETATEPDV